MKSITVKETKTVLMIRDLSGLHNKDFKCVTFDVDFDTTQKEVTIIREDLCIPVQQGDYNSRDLDTQIEVEGKTYYTCRRFLKEETITVSSKELFIPTFEGIAVSACDLMQVECKALGCSQCQSCILHKPNYKYLKE